MFSLSLSLSLLLNRLFNENTPYQKTCDFFAARFIKIENKNKQKNSNGTKEKKRSNTL